MRKAVSAIAVLFGLLGCTGAYAPTPATSTPVATGSPAGGPDCWVHIWEDENFQDDNDRIMGPGKWNNMRNLPGANKSDWGDEIDSIEMGPRASGVFWEDEGFADNSIRLGPGEKRTNLRGSPDLGDTIDSMEITCR